MKQEVPVNVAHRLIAGCPVVLITVEGSEGIDITTVPWVVPVSMNPLQVGVVLFPHHFAHDLINDAEQFAINVIPEDILKQARFCGTVSGREVDKFKRAGLTPADANEITAPLIEEAIGHLECGLVDRHTFGDHTFFVGQVLAASAESDLFDVAWQVKERELRPVFHLGKDYYAVWEERFEAKD
ncbi:MAG: flavin reductase family protein [Dehalococcoidales bacterium]|nr:flavin reductase family protein [Dehalococcoidales bacterium]